MLNNLAGVLYRRALENKPVEYELPSWAWAVVLADLVVFLPVILWVRRKSVFWPKHSL
jgi:hypothetical protein